MIDHHYNVYPPLLYRAGARVHGFLVLLAALLCAAGADRNSFDCEMRGLAVEFAQSLQPFLDDVRGPPPDSVLFH